MLLRTERLVLRPFREADVEVFAAFDREEAYRRHLGEDHPLAEQFVANNLGTDGAWVIEHEGRVIGSVFHGDELACLIDPAFHGRGFGPGAARAVIDDAFGRRGYEHVVAKAHPANVASLRAMVRLGFVPAGDGTHRLSRTAWRHATT